MMFGTCRRDKKAMVGGGGRRSRPPVLSPRGPAIANHLTRHEVHHHLSRRLDASDEGSQSLRTSNVQRDT